MLGLKKNLLMFWKLLNNAFHLPFNILVVELKIRKQFESSLNCIFKKVKWNHFTMSKDSIQRHLQVSGPGRSEEKENKFSRWQAQNQTSLSHVGILTSSDNKLRYCFTFLRPPLACFSTINVFYFLLPHCTLELCSEVVKTFISKKGS